MKTEEIDFFLRIYQSNSPNTRPFSHLLLKQLCSLFFFSKLILYPHLKQQAHYFKGNVH